jgi:hypothetical protein
MSKTPKYDEYGVGLLKGIDLPYTSVIEFLTTLCERVTCGCRGTFQDAERRSIR